MNRKTDTPTFLPYTRHWLDDDDIAAVTAVLRGDWLTSGPATTAFERALAATTGAREAVVCSSGTAALHLACMALGLRAGERALVPAITFVATANAPGFTGADIAFTDVDPDTGLMRAADMRAALARDGHPARVVLPVHLNGQVAPIEALSALAREQGLGIIEDGCHALGTRYTTRHGQSASVGDCRFSDATVFSFHPAKTIAMGEGGAVTTNDAALAAAMRRARNHGLVHDAGDFTDPAQAYEHDGERRPWYHEMPAPGNNYRASDIHCALGTSQLAKLPEFAARRATLMARYDEALQGLAPLVRPVPRVADCEPVLHLYPVHIDFARAGKTRTEVMQQLRARGIGTQVHYRPVHQQPWYRRQHPDLALPGARQYYERVLSLPFFTAMQNSDVSRVCNALREVL